MLDYVSLTSTFSTLTAVKGHCRADQYLEAVVGVDGAGDPRWGAHKMGGWCLTTHFSGAAQSLAVLLPPGLMVGFMRRGDKQYENIVLATYSPASLVLSKIL